jgi:hypothetical protein
MEVVAMKTLSIAQFKAQFGQVVSAHAPVVVRKRQVPVGIWQPLDGAKLRAKRSGVLRGFVNVGKSTRQDIAKRHDEYLYGATR